MQPATQSSLFECISYHSAGAAWISLISLAYKAMAIPKSLVKFLKCGLKLVKAVRKNSVGCWLVSCERCFDFINFIVEYKDSQQHVVPKIENRRQTAFVMFGYFDSGTSFQNSIIEKALFSICNPWSSLITPQPLFQ